MKRLLTAAVVLLPIAAAAQMAPAPAAPPPSFAPPPSVLKAFKLKPAEYQELLGAIGRNTTTDQEISPQAYVQLLTQIPLSDPAMTMLEQKELAAQESAKLPTPEPATRSGYRPPAHKN